MKEKSRSNVRDSPPLNPTIRKGSDIVAFIVRHPVWSFVLFVLLVGLISYVYWFYSMQYIFDSPRLGLSDKYANGSGLVQAIVGSALTGAGAFVAILIATSATKIADSALEESRTNNKINDPDYLAAKQALRGYQKYAFLVGTLLAEYRLHHQQKKLLIYTQAAFSRQGSDNGHSEIESIGDPKPGMEAFPQFPAWNETLRHLHELLLEVHFVSAIYEAARRMDEHSTDDPAQVKGMMREKHVWALRKNIAGVSSVIEQILDTTKAWDSESAMVQLLARCSLLDGQLRAGVYRLRKEAKSLKEDGVKIHGAGEFANFPLLKWLALWIDQMPDFDTDRDFVGVTKKEFEDVFFAESKSLRDLVRQHVDDVMEPSSREKTSDSSLGLHCASLAATLIGDQATLFTIENVVAEQARMHGMQPILVNLSSPDRFQDNSHDGINNKFYIFSCTRDNLFQIFNDRFMGPYTVGCVIIDGVRGIDSLCELENFLQSLKKDEIKRAQMEAEASGDKTRWQSFLGSTNYHIDDVVQILANWASANGKLRSSRLADLDPDKLDSGYGPGPRMAWIGIDYRDFGQSMNPSRLEGFDCELWAILARGGTMLGEDAVQMLVPHQLA